MANFVNICNYNTADFTVINLLTKGLTTGDFYCIRPYSLQIFIKLVMNFCF